MSSSGWHVFCSCTLHQYHYVAECMNWTAAQAYCREKYTDLATIENTKEMNQLMDTVSFFGYTYEVWIGLYGGVDWRWSDGYEGSGAEYRNWQTNKPDNQFCVMTGRSGSGNYSWWDHYCASTYPFICNNGKCLTKHYFCSDNGYFEIQYSIFKPFYFQKCRNTAES